MRTVCPLYGLRCLRAGVSVPSTACCWLVPVPTGDSPTTSAPTATTVGAATAATTDRPAAGPRNLFIVLVLAGVLLPVPAGPLALLCATFVALRSRMRPWIPALLVAGAIALTAPACTR